MNNFGDIPQNLLPDIPSGYGGNQRRYLPDKKIPDNQVNNPVSVDVNINTNKLAVKNANLSVQSNQISDVTKNILSANKNRVSLLIQNNGSTNVFVNFGNPATIHDIKIPAGGYYEPLIPPNNSVYLVSNTGNSNLCSVSEGI